MDRRVYTMELVRSFQVGEINRREFLTRATVAVGSAALASTVLAACTPVTGPTEPHVQTSTTLEEPWVK